MKKLIVIILILLVIFIGMYVNRKIEIDNKTVSVEEVEEIETYHMKKYKKRQKRFLEKTLQKLFQRKVQNI